MRNASKTFIIAVLITFIAGCNSLFVPSEEDIFAAMEASLRGAQSSLKQENMEIIEEYSNAADLAFVTEDETVFHEMSFMINEDKSADISGKCSLADYQDTFSGYIINGTFSYDLFYPNISNTENAYGEFNFEMDYTGGNIDTLELNFTLDKQGQIEKVYVAANGKEINIKMQKKIFNFLNYLDPSFLNK